MSGGKGRDERVVDSPRHSVVVLARDLEADRRTRTRQGLYIGWGLHLAQEALAARAPLRHVLTGPSLEESSEGRDLARRLRSAGAPILRTTTRILESIVQGSGDQGILMLLPRPEHRLTEVLDGRPSLLMAAHGVQDPGNLGSIVRTSLALGARAVLVLEGCADPLGSRAVRAGMGAHFRLPVAVARSAQAIEDLRAAGMQIVAADPEGPDLPHAVDLTCPTVLIVGNEGSGLPPPVLQAARRRIRIPMAAGISSLNVHAAAAALLYEAARQRGFAHTGAGR